MKDTWFLVMQRPLTLAAMPLTSMGPLGRAGAAGFGGAGAGSPCSPWPWSPGDREAASSREKARRGFMKVFRELNMGRMPQFLPEFSHGAGGLQAGKAGKRGLDGRNRMAR